MPALSDYVSGTITLTNGSNAFTGTGTGWQAADFREGDTILGIEDHAGVEYVIATIDGNGSGTLTQDWEGATGTYTYRMRYMADGARVTAQARNLIELLGNGNLQALAGLTGPGVPVFNGPHAMVIKPETDFINGVTYDVQVDTLADRAAYDGQSEGFAVLVSDMGDGRSALFSKASNASGDWTDPAYITGPVGPLSDVEATVDMLPPGSAPTVTPTPITGGVRLDFELPEASGFYNAGLYDIAEEYDQDDVVRHNGSSFIALQSVPTGTSPSSAFPPVDTAYWQVLAAKGADGSGTGDVVGPSGAVADRIAVFDGTTGKLIKDGGVTIGQLARDRKTVADLLADTVFSYTAGTGKTLVVPGQTITAQDFRYEVAASSATDAWLIETAGGVKLLPLAAGGDINLLAFGADAGASAAANSAALGKWLAYSNATGARMVAAPVRLNFASTFTLTGNQVVDWNDLELVKQFDGHGVVFAGGPSVIYSHGRLFVEKGAGGSGPASSGAVAPTTGGTNPNDHGIVLKNRMINFGELISWYNQGDGIHISATENMNGARLGYLRPQFNGRHGFGTSGTQDDMSLMTMVVRSYGNWSSGFYLADEFKARSWMECFVQAENNAHDGVSPSVYLGNAYADSNFRIYAENQSTSTPDIEVGLNSQYINLQDLRIAGFVNNSSKPWSINIQQKLLIPGSTPVEDTTRAGSVTVGSSSRYIERLWKGSGETTLLRRRVTGDGFLEHKSMTGFREHVSTSSGTALWTLWGGRGSIDTDSQSQIGDVSARAILASTGAAGQAINMGDIRSVVTAIGSANATTGYLAVTAKQSGSTTLEEIMRFAQAGATLPAKPLIMTEVSSDPTAVTDGAVLFARDNGSGKTQLCVRFATGAVSVLATEP